MMACPDVVAHRLAAWVADLLRSRVPQSGVPASIALTMDSALQHVHMVHACQPGRFNDEDSARVNPQTQADSVADTSKKCEHAVKIGQKYEHEASKQCERDTKTAQDPTSSIHHPPCVTLCKGSLHSEGPGASPGPAHQAMLADLAAECVKALRAHEDAQTAAFALRSNTTACDARCVLPAPSIMEELAAGVAAAVDACGTPNAVSSCPAPPSTRAMAAAKVPSTTAVVVAAQGSDAVVDLGSRWMARAAHGSMCSGTASNTEEDVARMHAMLSQMAVPLLSASQGLLARPVPPIRRLSNPDIPKLQQRPLHVWRRITHPSCLWSMYVPESMCRHLLPNIGTDGEEHGYALSRCALDEHVDGTANQRASAGHASRNSIGQMAPPGCAFSAKPHPGTFHTKIMVADVHQKCWPVKFSFHVTPKQYYRKLGLGWHDFCVAHGVGVGDAIEFRRLSGRFVTLHARVLKHKKSNSGKAVHGSSI